MEGCTFGRASVDGHVFLLDLIAKTNRDKYLTAKWNVDTSYLLELSLADQVQTTHNISGRVE